MHGAGKTRKSAPSHKRRLKFLPLRNPAQFHRVYLPPIPIVKLRLSNGETYYDVDQRSLSHHRYLIIGALVVVIAGLGVYVWNEESKPKGVEMNIGSNDVSVQEN